MFSDEGIYIQNHDGNTFREPFKERTPLSEANKQNNVFIIKKRQKRINSYSVIIGLKNANKHKLVSFAEVLQNDLFLFFYGGMCSMSSLKHKKRNI